MPVIDLKKIKFNLGIRLQPCDGFDLPPYDGFFTPFFDLVVKMRYWTNNTDMKEIVIPTKKCEKSDFYNQFDESFEANNIETCDCLDIKKFEEENPGVNFDIKGLYTYESYNYLLIQLIIK